MTPEEQLRARREAEDSRPADLAAKRTGRVPKTLLASPPPAADASQAELAGWLTAQLGLGASPIASAVRYGLQDDARLVITLQDGKRIPFDRQSDAFDPARLVRTVVLRTGAEMPSYGRTDAQAIATRLVRLAELIDEDDDRAEAAEWARAFLAGAAQNTIHVAEMVTPHGRYEALSALAKWKVPDSVPPPPLSSVAERSVIVLDAATGLRLVRTSDMAAHVRSTAGRSISWAALHGRMVEIGWEHRGEMQQRQPGGHLKIKANVYAVPSEWGQS